MKKNTDPITVIVDIQPHQNNHDALVIIHDDDVLTMPIDLSQDYPFLRQDDSDDDAPVYLVDLLPDPDSIYDTTDDDTLDTLDERCMLMMITLWQQFRCPITCQLTWHPTHWHLELDMSNQH